MSDNNTEDNPREPTQGLYLLAFIFSFAAMCYIIVTKGNFLV